MRLFRLGGIKRLYLSLALSFSFVFIMTTISWDLDPVTSGVDYSAYDFEELDKAVNKQEANPSDRLDGAIDTVVSSQPNSGFDPNTATPLKDHLKNKENLKPDYFPYLWDAILDGAGAAFFAIAAGLFLVLSTINQYIKEASIGWKRLSLISSFVIGLGICLYIYFGDILRGDDFFLSLLSFPILLSVLLYAKVLYLWVKDGFESDNI
jgi:hypothetical protein